MSVYSNLNIWDDRLIASPRLILSPVEEKDVTEEYVLWLQDPEVNQFLETRFQTQTKESVLSYVRQKLAQFEIEPFFKILAQSEKKHIGNIKLGPISPHHQCADVSLFLGDKSSWGHGFGAEAIALITYFAFEKKGLLKLQAGCYSANLGSAKAFEKCGYKREAVLRERVTAPGTGERMDVYLYGITLNDFKREIEKQ